MKYKKIFLFLLMFFVGIMNCKAAVDLTIKENKDIVFKEMLKYYRVIGMETYYYNYYYAGFPGAESSNDVWEAAFKAYNPPGMCQSVARDLYREYESGRQSENYTVFVNSVMGCAHMDVADPAIQEVIRGYMVCGGGIEECVAKRKSLPSMLRYLEDILHHYKTDSTADDLRDVIASAKVTYEDGFCSYLNKHAGTRYYITTILQTISYIVIGLAILLGGIDFVEAILSDKDDALTKAFQKFVKRLVAAVLVFFAYLIVRIFMGLVSELPGVDAESAQICTDFEIGEIKS